MGFVVVIVAFDHQRMARSLSRSWETVGNRLVPWSCVCIEPVRKSFKSSVR